MIYSVLWRDTAEANLLASLLRSADKPALWAVARAIDSRLRTNPGAEGESRGSGWRLTFARPFAVLFRIDESARTVVIEQLKWVGY
jgi:hypothetical protein